MSLNLISITNHWIGKSVLSGSQFVKREGMDFANNRWLFIHFFVKYLYVFYILVKNVLDVYLNCIYFWINVCPKHVLVKIRKNNNYYEIANQKIYNLHSISITVTYSYNFGKSPYISYIS